MSLYEWAIKWGVPAAAVHDLQTQLGLNGATVTPEVIGKSEAYAQSVVRREAARKGVRLFRNNVGVLEDKSGRPVRFGLANDSKQVNDKIKSGDLIGWRPVMITPGHVGQVIAQFVSREIKKPGWLYTGTPHEVAQLNWANLVVAGGGDAAFATCEGTL